MSVWPIWALTLAAAIWIIVATPHGVFVWLAITLGSAALLACTVQLVKPQTPGIVDRVSAAVFGSFIILLIASGVLVLFGRT